MPGGTSTYKFGLSFSFAGVDRLLFLRLLDLRCSASKTRTRCTSRILVNGERSATSIRARHARCSQTRRRCVVLQPDFALSSLRRRYPQIPGMTRAQIKPLLHSRSLARPRTSTSSVLGRSKAAAHSSATSRSRLTALRMANGWHLRVAAQRQHIMCWHTTSQVSRRART